MKGRASTPVLYSACVFLLFSSTQHLRAFV